MLKTACLFTGDNYTLLSADTPASKKKVVAMSIAMLLPTLIWIFNGFMLSFDVLKSSIGWSILVAILCGVIVFLVEKLIIMANGNRWLTFFRICIGLIVAMLGSLAIDEVIFKDDIDIRVARLKADAIAEAKIKEEENFNLLNDISAVDADINRAQTMYDNAVSLAIAEADGTKGTGNKGVGEVAKFKDRKAEERKQDLSKLILKKESFSNMKDSLVNLSGSKAATNFHENALLTRIKALFSLVKEDSYMLFTYILFSLLMFFFEFLVVILKLTWVKTNYERKLEMIEIIGKKRMELLQKPDSALLDPGNYSNQFDQTRFLLKKSTSIYN